jgi:apolipoprotein D and lipocalin family protein
MCLLRTLSRIQSRRARSRFDVVAGRGRFVHASVASGRYVWRCAIFSPSVSPCVVVCCVGSPAATERHKLPPLITVEHVNLERYLGTWFEVASFPQGFQAGCTATSATYALRADGEIDVRCRKGTINGEESIAHGRARVVDATSNAKLEVSFFGPFWGDYWILSRTRTMSPDVYDGILARLQQQNYDVTRLVKTAQPTE